MKKALLLLAIALCLLTQAQAEIGSIRITGMTVLDSGNLTDSAPFQTIDTLQGSCTSQDQISEEPFYDTIINFEVENTSALLFRVNSVRFVIRLSDGRRIRSKRISPLQSFDIYPESSGEIKSFFLNAREGVKYFYRTPDELIAENGFRNIKFILLGKTADNQARKIIGKSAVSFTNIDRCE